MKALVHLLVFACFLATHSLNAALVEREWQSRSGYTAVGTAESVSQTELTLRLSSGQTVQVPFEELAEADLAWLREHFAEMPDPNKPQGSGLPAAQGLPYEQGKVLGPIEASGNAHYYLYLPKSLKQGREAPLLFYTHPSGGSKGIVDRISEGAELNGWIIAASVESKNGRYIQENAADSNDCIEDILKTLPVDKKRLYFTGISGGGAVAWANSKQWDGAGVMPTVSYLPYGVEPEGDHFFIMGGSRDYCRYVSAKSRKEAGKDAIHRFFSGGHEGMKSDLAREGMLWLNGRYLAEQSRGYDDEKRDYELALIEWIESQKRLYSHKGYYWTQFLLNEYGISGHNAAIVKKLDTELGADPKNRLYVEGIAALDELSASTLSKVEGAEDDHTDSATKAKAEALLEIYADTPEIGRILEGLASPTIPAKGR